MHDEGGEAVRGPRQGSQGVVLRLRRGLLLGVRTDVGCERPWSMPRERWYYPWGTAG